MTITEFLLTRIAEDESDVRGHAFDREVWDTGVMQCRHESHRLAGWSSTCWRAQVSVRVLAECEAKRAAIEAAWDDHMRIEGEWGMCRSVEELDALGDAPGVVTAFAAVHADHPDYDPAWRP